MDYITRQFINLTKKFRKELRQALQKQTDSISQATKAARENKQEPLPVPLPVLAELQIPEADKTEQRTQYDQSHTLQILLTVGTWLAFLAAAVYAGIAARQLKVMRGQLGEIIKQYPEIQKSAKAAGDAVTDSEQQFHEGRRAWMGTSIFLIDSYPSPFHGIIEFKNSGLTPALRLKHAIQLSIRKAPLLPDPTYDMKHPYRFTEGGATPPGGVFNSLLEDSEESPVTPTVLLHDKAIQNKAQFLYIHGELRYDDIDGKSHSTTFCFYMDDLVTHRLLYCKRHNDMK
jgi:hypothetical protein